MPSTIRSGLNTSPNKFKENLQFLVYFIVPIVAAVLFIPYFVDPVSVEKFTEHFHVIVLSKPFCKIKPNVCAKSLDPQFVDRDSVLVKVFENYELIYVRHRTVAKWDKTLISVFNFFLPRRLLLWFLRTALNRNIEDAEFWVHWDETLEVMLAIGNSMMAHTAKGVILSRMWMFFVFGSFITISESWAGISGPLSGMCRAAVNVF